jgi:hypothetical protein
MAVPCPQCNTQLPDQVAFCTGCGLRMFVGAADERAPILLPDRILGAVAYFSFIPAVGFLVFEKFKRNRYLRFHSLQSIYLAVAAVLMGHSAASFIGGFLADSADWISIGMADRRGGDAGLFHALAGLGREGAARRALSTSPSRTACRKLLKSLILFAFCGLFLLTCHPSRWQS